MSILGRLTLRNITGKPLRSFAIIIALAASAFAMLFCVGGRNAPEQELRRTLLNYYAGSEILILDKSGDLTLNEADLPEGTRMLKQSAVESTAKCAKGEYAVRAMYMDTGLSGKMGMTDTDLDLANGTYISSAFAQKAELSAGDEITLESEDGSPVTVKITAVSDDKYLRRSTSTVLTSLDNVRSLGGFTGSGIKTAYVDVPDETDVAALAKELTEKYAEKEYIINPLLTDEMLEQARSQTLVFYLIFAVILLMTLFLTVSMSRHIANERIAVIGTLRSLGGSIPKTSRILLVESTVYGIVGGVLGAIGYMLAGNFAVSVMFGQTEEGWSIPLIAYPLAVVMTVLIQLVCQSSALIKAVRTPVRDIIFSSRETAYVISVKKHIIGAVMLASGIVLGMVSEDIVMSIASIALICVGGVMVLPIVLKLISKVFAKLFGLMGMPVAKLAAIESSHKKSSVASTQLTFVALAITAAIFITSESIAKIYEADIYHFDARIGNGFSEEQVDKILSIPGITDSQCLSAAMLNAEINGSNKRMIEVTPYDDFRLFTSLHISGSEPAEDEIYIGDSFAKRMNISEGDTIEVLDCDDTILNEDGTEEHPVYSFKVKGMCNAGDFYVDTIVVSKSWYKENMNDYVDYIYVNLESKGTLDALIKELDKRVRNAELTTREELLRQDDEDKAQLMTILYGITAIGCVLALLGSVSNAVIGFEQSKRKYAVLHSVAASKKKLCKLILLETLFSAVTAGCLALLTGLMLAAMIKNTMIAIGLGIDIVYDIPMTLIFIGVLTVLLLLAAVKPILSLRKMNTAAELKYE